MRLHYGSYSFPVNGVVCKTHTTRNDNAAGITMTLTTVMNVSGDLLVDVGSVTPQQDMTTAQRTLEAALSVPYQDLLFKDDNGNNTATVLQNAGSISGVRITDGPNFEGERATGEYATRRNFSFTAQVETPFTGRATNLVSFSESIDFSGGGPIRVMARAINLPPIRQITWPYTEYTATQSGEAVGLLTWPFGNNPKQGPPYKFPAAYLKEAPSITASGPDRIGPNGFRNYRVRWVYKFEHALPLIAAPTLWNF